MPFHEDTPRGDVHGIHYWAYATIADRDAHSPSEGPARAVNADDVSHRRVCYVEAENAFYALVNHSPLAWRPLGGVKEATEPAPERNTNVGNLRLRSVNGNASHRFTFPVPIDFHALVSLELLGVPAASFTDQDIDLFSDYGEAPGENTAQHSESDTATLYSGTVSQWLSIDLSAVFSAIEAGDVCGVLVDHNSIGVIINYYGVRMRYV